MSMDIRQIASLAKIRIENDEMAAITRGISAVMNIVDQLPDVGGEINALDERDVMPLRPDIVQRSLSRDEILASAPQKNAGCFVVPKTL